MRFHKKGSLEISIQAIVIVVLAMTLLGLGLGFIRKQFRGIGNIEEQVSEQVRQRILDDLISGDKKVSFPATDVTIDKGGSTVLTIGLKNKKDSPLHYTMKFTPISGPDGGVFSITNPNWFQYGENKEYILAAADSDVRNIRLSVPTSVASGSYFLTFDIMDGDVSGADKTYAEKDFFIVIRK